MIVAWAAVSLAELPPFDRPVAPEEHRLELIGVAMVGCRSLRLRDGAISRALPAPRRRASRGQRPRPGCSSPRPSSRSRWRAAGTSPGGSGICMMTARLRPRPVGGATPAYRRSASVAAAFGGVYLDATLERVDTRTADGLRAILSALSSPAGPVEPVLARAPRPGLHRRRDGTPRVVRARAAQGRRPLPSVRLPRPGRRSGATSPSSPSSGAPSAR